MGTFAQVVANGLFNISDCSGVVTPATFKENASKAFSRGEIIMIHKEFFDTFCQMYSVNLDKNLFTGKSAVFYVSKEFFLNFVLEEKRNKFNEARIDQTVNECWKKCLEWYYSDYYSNNYIYTSFMGKDKNFRI